MHLKAGYVTPEGTRQGYGYGSASGGVPIGVVPIHWNLATMRPVVCIGEEVQVQLFFCMDAACTNASAGDSTSVE